MHSTLQTGSNRKQAYNTKTRTGYLTQVVSMGSGWKEREEGSDDCWMGRFDGGLVL